jgi:hypothetical protein
MADVITSTQLATKQALISSMVQKELAVQAKLVNFVSDLSPLAMPGMDRISFPKLTSFTATARAEGVSGDAVALTSSLDTLILDQNISVQYVIDSLTVLQNNINAEVLFAQRAAAGQARFVDSYLLSKIVAGANSFLNVGADVDITYANLLAMLEAVEIANGDVSQCSWIVSPHQKNVLLNLAEVKNFYQFGQAVVPSGAIGSIMGIPLVVSNQLANKQAFLVSKDAVAIGFQRNSMYDEQKDVRFGPGAKRAIVEQTFGAVVLNTVAGKSTHIIGLND